MVFLEDFYLFFFSFSFQYWWLLCCGAVVVFVVLAATAAAVVAIGVVVVAIAAVVVAIVVDVALVVGSTAVVAVAELIPDNMEEAFGFDPDAMDDKPFLKHEVTQQLQHQLQRIKEETSARMTNSSDTQQQSGISASGLIDTAHKIRAEKVKIKQNDGVTCVVVCGCFENTGTYLFLFFVIISCLCVFFF